jgi:2-oxoglutarate dehydrogenase E1 component
MVGPTENGWESFTGLNAAYLQDLYERFLADPAAVSPETRRFFETQGAPAITAPESPASTPAPVAASPGAPCGLSPTQIAGAVTLATAIRGHGYRAAQLDPLGSAPPGDATLQFDMYGLREEDLAALPASIVGGAAAASSANALDAIHKLRQTYQHTIGYDFEHVSNAVERAWLYEAVECGRFSPPIDPIDDLQLLQRLTDVGAFERFLQLAFPGQTRFSLEGLGMMVPVLDEIIGAAAEAGTRSMFLGMAHRGRLNVLTHTLGKSYEQIIGEFMGRFKRNNGPITGNTGEGWTGDVKYHLDARRAIRNGEEVVMNVYLAPNPSHLEWINPVVEGMARACDENRSCPGPAVQDNRGSMAVLIHGDAAFPGQGVVAETLNLSRLPGYTTGGTIHIIANNQLGFTTGPKDGRSTLFSSDLAKGFEIPIIHVNADDPEACITAARLAHAYREQFHGDVLIDLIGYRRRGHNEGDEPSFTQPRMYSVIAEHSTVRDLWAKKLIERGIITKEASEATLKAAVDRLQAIRKTLADEQAADQGINSITSGLEAGGATGGIGDGRLASQIETAVPLDELAKLNRELYDIPTSFHLHAKLEKPFAARREMITAPEKPTGKGRGKKSAEPASNGQAAEGRIEWAHAESLAFASILADGSPVRLTGQDVGRGPFSQRHLALHDFETGERYIPLQHLPSAKASFEAWNSPLSEQAALGFEFGYSVQAPDTLTLWEAQYGDFVNVPQVIIDQFIVSARSKWEQLCGLVMLLPHGYEGQGPEHSSARPERFLQMVAEDNLRIVNCTTAAQYFHLLRRQATLLKLDPRPLIVLSPKSLLRNPLAASRPEELGEGKFQPLLADAHSDLAPERVRRLVLCSGKVYFDFVTAREKLAKEKGRQPDVVAWRVEELYPFPAEEVGRLCDYYANLEEVVWLQEEPRNMGAWTYVAPRLRDLLRNRYPLMYVGRTRRSSPSEGSYKWHLREQARLIEAALSWVSVGKMALAGADAAGEDEVDDGN